MLIVMVIISRQPPTKIVFVIVVEVAVTFPRRDVLNNRRISQNSLILKDIQYSNLGVENLIDCRREVVCRYAICECRLQTHIIIDVIQ